jgi:hypothetical protein
MIVTASSPRSQAVLRLPSAFQDFLDILEDGIEALIVRAVKLETSLLRLEERLDRVGHITVEEVRAHLPEEDQVPDRIWTQFGANRQTPILEQELYLLKTIHEHRRLADSRISSVRSKLRVMKASLKLHLRPLASSLLLYDVDSLTGLIMHQIKVGAGRLNDRGASDLGTAGYEAGGQTEM